MKKVKLTYNGKEYLGTVKKDKRFLGGKKVIFEIENGVTVISSIELVKII